MSITILSANSTRIIFVRETRFVAFVDSLRFGVLFAYLLHSLNANIGYLQPGPRRRLRHEHGRSSLMMRLCSSASVHVVADKFVRDCFEDYSLFDVEAVAGCAEGTLRLIQRRTAISCLLYTSPSPRDPKTSRMPSSA